MKNGIMIRLVLLVVCAANFYAAYLFFMTPEIIADIFQLPPLDNVHNYLTMIIGALLSVFGLGALLAFARPRKYGTIIIMLLLMHFMIFLIDVIVLARGQMPWEAILPELVYFLIVSTALVRWYPINAPKKEEKKPEEPEAIKPEVLDPVE
jgi:hypothetical protein